MAGPKPKTYKRSWRNLLLDKGTQLRFTLFMVLLSAVLMGLLGWWVTQVAELATTVAKNNVMSVRCKEPTPPGGRDVVVEMEMQIFEPGEEPSEVPDPGEAGLDLGDEAAAVTPEEQARYQSEKRLYDDCMRRQNHKLVSLDNRFRLIGGVLVAVGLVLLFGLFVYGIKMTHRVAGPLYKVGLYLTKLKDGTYDRVHDLRKGDHLLEFYAQFKAAHRGLRRMQEEDVARLRAILEVAERTDLAAKSPEIAAALKELRALLEEKEGSLVG